MTAETTIERIDQYRWRIPRDHPAAGAGTGRRVTLMNCCVMGTLDDSLDGIFRALQEAAITLQQGGDVGTDFSPLRPKGARTDATGGRSSGPVSFMQLWEQMCATVTDASPRRGAMMGVLACDHPDIHAFVAAKRVAGRLTHFNVSVLVQDAFMRAVAGDGPWTLAFPRFGIERTTRPRDLWGAVVGSAYASAEPGVLFMVTKIMLPCAYFPYTINPSKITRRYSDETGVCNLRRGVEVR